MIKRVQAAWDALVSGRMSTKYRKLISIRSHPVSSDLVILNYTNECQYKKAWDNVTTACRGLILNTKTGELVALPFPKFFNIGERPKTQMDVISKIPFTIFEKVDGFLGISYRGPNGLAIASRGSFSSEMAERGTNFLRRCDGIDGIPQNLTFLFEIVYLSDEIRLATKYDFEGLVLLAIFDRFSGAEIRWSKVEKWAQKLGVRTPKVYQFASIADAIRGLKELPGDLEGYVARFSNGLRVKLKNRKYLERVRILMDITSGKVREALINGQYEWWLFEVVPEEFREEVEALSDPMILKARKFKEEVSRYFSLAPKRGGRKAFASWVIQNVANRQYQYALYLLMEGREPNWYELARQ